MRESMLMCGPTSYLDVLVGGLALVLAIVALVIVLSGQRVGMLVSGVALALAVFAGLGGVVGRQLGRTKVDAALALPGVDRAQVGWIRAEGYREADECLTIGGVAAAPGGVLAAVALVLAASRKPRAASTT